MIGVPTKDHPKHMQIYLAKVLEDAKLYGIDLHIYDSSENDTTEQIVKKRIKNGYNNLYYHRYEADDITLPPVAKLKDILVDSGYEYVWLCGDGIILNLDNVIPYIIQEMNKSRDLIIFNFLERKGRYIEYHDPVKMILEQWQSISLNGGTIYKGDFFTRIEWDDLISIYPHNIHLAGVFDILAKKEKNVVSLDTQFFVGNIYKKEATWITGGRLLQAVADHMSSEIENLPHIYDPVKGQVKHSFARLRGMFLLPNLWWLRANDNISFQKICRYRKQLKQVTNTKYIFFLCGSFVPKKVAEKLASIFSNA